MKKIIIMVLLSCLVNTYGQNNTLYLCNEKFTTLDKLNATPTQAALYDMLPKLLTYNDYCFLEIYAQSVLQNSEYTISAEYGILNTDLRMKVKITDFGHPFFQTKSGLAAKSVKLFVFKQANPTLFGAHSFNDLNKFTKNYIIGSRFSSIGGKGDNVGFVGYHKDRYFIDIELSDKGLKYTKPEEVKEYLKKYIAQINLQ